MAPGAFIRMVTMIQLTRLNKSEIMINSDLIQYVEETPDTVITMTNGQKIVVVEHASEIVTKVVEFKRRIFIQEYIK